MKLNTTKTIQGWSQKKERASDWLPPAYIEIELQVSAISLTTQLHPPGSCRGKHGVCPERVVTPPLIKEWFHHELWNWVKKLKLAFRTEPCSSLSLYPTVKIYTTSTPPTNLTQRPSIPYPKFHHLWASDVRNLGTGGSIFKTNETKIMIGISRGKRTEQKSGVHVTNVCVSRPTPWLHNT